MASNRIGVFESGAETMKEAFVSDHVSTSMIQPMLLHAPATPPPIVLLSTLDDRYVIFDGVTRATRAAVLRPGEAVPAIVIGQYPVESSKLASLSERLST
jgi:hypothetical protein